MSKFRQKYTINQNKFNTRRKLTTRLFISRSPQSRLTRMERVRACESGRSVIETRYCALLRCKKRRHCAGFVCFFRQKYREIAYYLCILYFLKGYLSDPRAPQCWKETHFLENFTFSCKNAYCSMHAGQIKLIIVGAVRTI